MPELVRVFKVVRRDRGVLKSAVIGTMGSDDHNYTKFKQFELEYPVGVMLKRRCLAFNRESDAINWMYAMIRQGFSSLEVWEAHTNHCVPVDYVANLTIVTVKEMGAVCGSQDFFDRSIQNWDSSNRGQIKLRGQMYDVVEFNGAVRCRDLALYRRVYPTDEPKRKVKRG